MKQSDFDLSRTEWENAINEWIFSEEDRAMLKRRLLDHITIEKLAEEFNFSVQHTSRKVNHAKNELFLHLK
jgi:AraC-like DNA-binding protein